MNRFAFRLTVLFPAVLGLSAPGAESGLYEHFQAAAHTEVARACRDGSRDMVDPTGYIWDSSLVDTNHSGPSLATAPVSYTGFTSRGELAGVKLGMTMSEVVAEWGKPKQFLYSDPIFHYKGDFDFVVCSGPVFYYGAGHYRDLSLFFNGERLRGIRIFGTQAEQVTFDNGLTGRMGAAGCEMLLGAPAAREFDTEALRETNFPHFIYSGRLGYRAGNLSTQIEFVRRPAHAMSGPVEKVHSFTVLDEREVHPYVEPPGEPTGASRSALDTNRASAASTARRSP